MFENDQKILLIDNTNLSDKIKLDLIESFQICCSININKGISVLRQTLITCNIIHVPKLNYSKEIEINKLISLFPMIPNIIVCPDNKFEIVRRCGEMGINSAIAYSDLTKLEDKIRYEIAKNSFHVNLVDFGIRLENCTKLVRDAVGLIQNMYLKSITVQEIAEILCTNSVRLSQEFKKCCPFGPKKLIMYLRTKHAIFLMANSGFSLTEISQLTGFSDLRRFNECFHSIFGTSPRQCRKGILISGVHKFWKNNTNIINSEKKNRLKKKLLVKQTVAQNNDRIYGYERFRNFHTSIFQFIHNDFLYKHAKYNF